MKLFRFALALVAATVLHALMSRWIGGFPAAVDLFLVLAVLNGLSSSAGWSALGGSAAGLVRDALSGGLYGLHGFSDTLAAWAAARLQQRLVIVKPLQVGLLLALAAALQLSLLQGLQVLLLPQQSEFPSLATGLTRLASSGLLGSVFFVLSARTRDAVARRREQRRRRLRMAI